MPSSRCPYEGVGVGTAASTPCKAIPGIDIMRTVRSFDPCLPCGVHMYLGHGKVLKTLHAPTFGVQKP